MPSGWRLPGNRIIEEACRGGRIVHPPTCASHLAALSYLRKEKKGRRGPSMEMSSLKGERTTTVRLPPRSGVPKIGASLNPFPCAPPCRLWRKVDIGGSAEDGAVTLDLHLAQLMEQVWRRRSASSDCYSYRRSWLSAGCQSPRRNLWDESVHMDVSAVRRLLSTSIPTRLSGLLGWAPFDGLTPNEPTLENLAWHVRPFVAATLMQVGPTKAMLRSTTKARNRGSLVLLEDKVFIFFLYFAWLLHLSCAPFLVRQGAILVEPLAIQLLRCTNDTLAHFLCWCDLHVATSHAKPFRAAK
jgi:hypothetical protein